MWIADFNHAVSATCLCNSNVQYVVNHTVTPSRLTNTLLCRAVSCLGLVFLFAYLPPSHVNPPTSSHTDASLTTGGVLHGNV